MSDDFYPGPASDRISEFTRARAAEVRAELIAIAESMAQLPSLADLFFNRLGYVVATGTANSIIVTTDPAPETYFDGMGLTVKVAETNTGPATINVNGLGVKALRRPDGVALSPGDLQAGAIVNLRYEGTSEQFRVMVGTVTINQEGVDLVTTQAREYRDEADDLAAAAAESAAAAAASIAPYTATDVLSKLATVDGVGSGLDADRLHGRTPTSIGLDVVAAASTAAARAAIGLNNVDNTSDANKPVSTATSTALDLKLNAASVSAFGLTLIDDASATAARTTLGLGNVDNTSDQSKPVSTAQQAAIDGRVAKSGDTMTGALTLSGNPTANLHAASKQYVDAMSQGWRTLTGGSARVATTASHALSGLAAIDGVTPVAGDRILVKDQANPAENGIYVAAAGAWSRAADADSIAELYNTVTLVREGTSQANSTWVASVSSSGTLGVTAIPYSQVGSQTTYTASGGISKIGNEFYLTTAPALTLKGNSGGSPATPTDLTVASVKTMLNLAGSNTGDQTITLTGAVTGSGTGSFATSLASNVATNAVLADMPTATIKGRSTAGTGDPEDLSVATVKSMLNLSGTNTGDQTSVTGNAGTATALQTARTIGSTGDVVFTTAAFNGTANVTGSASIQPNVVTNTELADMPTSTIKGRATAGTGDPENLSVATVKSMLSLSGTNTGDQTKESLGLGPTNNVSFQDVTASRGNGTGVLFFGAGNAYLYFDGATYQMPTYGLSVGGPIAAANFSGTHSGTSSGTNTGDQTTISGNAGSATALQTARNFSISGAVTAPAVSFNGTGNVNLAISTLDVGQANAGVLAVARGGTGVQSSTGSGSVVLNNAPSFAGTAAFVNISASGTISATGNISTNGNLTAYSDLRLKTNVRTIDDALSKVNEMRGVTFQRKADRETSSGVIAQELASIAPELVIADDQGMLSVAYGNLVGYLIEAVKELTQRVVELEARD